MREILEHFDGQSAPLSVNQMAHEMDITPGVLRGMIDHLVRRGKLREVSPGGTACTACGVKGTCPFVVALPVYYERIHDDDDAVQSAAPSCWQG
jgi:hypothetical protein